MKPVKQSFIKSIFCAITGITIFLQKERNGKIQIILFIVVIIVLKVFQAPAFLFVVFVLNWAIVICFEMLNTAIEEICNLIHPTYHHKIKKIKDISAGAVLMMSVVALTIVLFYLIIY